MSGCEHRIFGIVVEKTSGSLHLHFLVGRLVERLPSEPESSLEFMHWWRRIGGTCRPPGLILLRVPLGSSPPSPVAHSQKDYDSDDGALVPGELCLSAGASFFSHLRWRQTCAF